MTSLSEVDRREQFEALVQSVYVPLQRYLRRRADPWTAEDVLGDVLVVLWRRADSVPPDAPLAWSYGVARGCLANAVRAKKRQRHLLVRLLDHAADRDQPESSAHPELDEALAALSDADREILRLWAWEGLAPREIAIVLGITPNAASIRLHRATRRLRTRLTAGKSAPGAGHLAQRQEGRQSGERR